MARVRYIKTDQFGINISISGQKISSKILIYTYPHQSRITMITLPWDTLYVSMYIRQDKTQFP